MKLLVLGAGRHQAPLIQRAEDRGITTIAVDYYTDSPGKKVASHAVLADALDVDAVIAAARDHEVNAVATVGTDQVMVVVAAVAHELGLPCHVTPIGALAATHKVHMRRALEDAGVEMTTGVIVGPETDLAALATIALPCVVKAADSQGQRGMQRIDNASELEEAVRTAVPFSRTSTVVVEEFAAGPELTINAWMRNGEPIVLIPADRDTYNPSPAIGICLRHVAPSTHAHQHLDEFRTIARNVALGYGVTDGPLYIQMLATSDGFRVVEAACRVGGGHEAQLFQAMYGLDLLDLTIDLAFGRNDRPVPSCPLDRGGLVNFVVAQPGVIASQSAFEELVDSEAISHGQWYVDIGYEQTTIVDSMGRVGAFIVTSSSRANALEKAAAAYAQVHATDSAGRDLVFWPEAGQMNTVDNAAPT